MTRSPKAFDNSVNLLVGKDTTVLETANVRPEDVLMMSEKGWVDTGRRVCFGFGAASVENVVMEKAFNDVETLRFRSDLTAKRWAKMNRVEVL